MICWDKLAKDNGFDGIEICYQQVNFFLSNDDRKKLFRHNIEYETAYVIALSKKNSHNFIRYLKFVYHKIFNKVEMNVKRKVIHFSYDEAWEFILNRTPTKGAIPCAMVGWDNTPRRSWRGSVYDGNTPKKFEKYMTQLIKKTKIEYSEDKLFVFVWNEWAEGGYLEPDTRFEYQYLEAIRNALKNNGEL